MLTFAVVVGVFNLFGLAMHLDMILRLRSRIRRLEEVLEIAEPQVIVADSGMDEKRSDVPLVD